MAEEQTTTMFERVGGRPWFVALVDRFYDAVAQDPVLRHSLGDGFSEYYVTSREWELKAWRETVTEWERERYERAV